MVSTRGLKVKFSEGEKVLCYEPDPTKAKVLYDSKVLEVIVNKDQRGRKAVEYLIHFQGWNSSWDRCVNEDYVLKDTDENRQLQRDLAEKAQLQFGAYLYRRERKKRHRKLSDKINESLKARRRAGGGSSSDEVSSESQSQQEVEDETDEEEEEDEEDEEEEDDDDDDENGSTSEGESSVDLDDERMPLELGDVLKKALELDFELITRRNKLHILPADPNVVTILEGYVRQYAVNQISGSSEKQHHRFRYQQTKVVDMEKVHRSLNICKEVVDGLRIYFDFTLGGLLLYNQEREQCEKARNIPVKQETVIGFFDELDSVVVKQEHEDSVRTNKIILDSDKDVNAHCSSTNHAENITVDTSETGYPGRKRSLRSHRQQNTENVSFSAESNGHGKSLRCNDHITSNENYPVQTIKQESAFCNNLSSFTSTSSGCTSPSFHPATSSVGITCVNNGTQNATTANLFLSQVLSWQLVPDNIFAETPVAPSLVYGATHLARLFVKLPHLLQATAIPERKLRVLHKHLDMLLTYIEENVDWFGEQFYKDDPRAMNGD